MKIFLMTNDGDRSSTDRQNGIETNSNRNEFLFFIVDRSNRSELNENVFSSILVMAELQAEIELTIELRKFINIDLFVQG